jgi:hypothetical protein
MAEQAPQLERTVNDLVYVGFNSRVVALDRYTGETVWDWKSPEGTGFVSVMLDIDRLIVSVMGYTYCLDPLFGQEVWRNQLRGMGTGVASLASVGGVQLNAAAIAAQAALSQKQQTATTGVMFVPKP